MRINYTNFSADVFPGFYESTLFNSDMFNNVFYGECPEGFEIEFREGGFDKYSKDVSELWVDAMRSNLSENPIEIKIGRLKDIDSPREYNYRTNRITVSIDVNLNRLKKYCFVDRAEEFNDYLYTHWRSRSGFISFIPCSLNAFKSEYRNEPGNRGALAEIMLEWYLLKFVDFVCVEEDVYDQLWDCMTDNICLQSTDDFSRWEMEFDGEMYKPVKKIA